MLRTLDNPLPLPVPLLEVRDVSKRFPGVRALHRVSLRLQRGEVLAVIGENGAGKSTLMKILAGIEQPDAGEIRLDGRIERLDSVRTAAARGIALIHQELNLADNLDVGANIYLGREPHRWGLLNRAAIDRQAAGVLRRVGLEVAPRTIVSTLPLGQRQLVEIAKALSADARILIMDEPTSSLSASEAATLFQVVTDLRARGVSVIYISHRLSEVQELADRVTVLRDGENAGELARQELTHDRLVQLMVGRDVSRFYARQQHATGAPVLEVRDLTMPAHPEQRLSLMVRAGEIVGVAGLVGAGRTELLRTLFGVDQALAGTVQVHGRPVLLRSPQEAIAAGIALVPEDRRQAGLIVEMTVRQNVTLAGLRRDQLGWGLRNRRKERAVTEAMITRLSIRTPHARQVVGHLSGGNQQKVVLGKWLALQPQVLLLDEPTRGIDVGAKQEIYQLMEQLAAQGVAILFVSSELEEILGLSDRVLVLHQGRMAGELPRTALSEEAVMRLATGGETRAA